jgi:hypothetical protein
MSTNAEWTLHGRIRTACQQALPSDEEVRYAIYAELLGIRPPLRGRRGRALAITQSHVWVLRVGNGWTGICQLWPAILTRPKEVLAELPRETPIGPLRFAFFHGRTRVNGERLRIPRRFWSDVAAADSELVRLAETSEKIFELPQGPLSDHSSARVRGRVAEFGIPEGWTQSTPEEVAAQQREEQIRAMRAGEDDFTTICATLYRPEFIQQQPYVIRVLEVPMQPVAFQPAQWAAGIAHASGLSLTGPVVSIRFGEAVAYVWHLQGLVPGAELGRPAHSPTAIHRAEMWAELPEGLMKILLIAPLERASEGLDALYTFLSSWRWVGASENPGASERSTVPES